MTRTATYQGAWMTDIDDTLLLSGEYPSVQRLEEIARFIKVLKDHDVLWIPMSGVAMVKLGPRILNRLPEELLSHVLYYGGDGSLKYLYDEKKRRWYEDDRFSSLLSDAQSYRILGEKEFSQALEQLAVQDKNHEFSAGERIDEARKILKSRGYPLGGAILDILKNRLETEGLNPGCAETYFRGGSISWMMLGDISAEPYYEPRNHRLRTELIRMSEHWLWASNHLEDLGSAGVTVPFPGARGIKFVLKGNSKERSARELMEWTGLAPEQLLYAGNELFDGGNDNMLRNIDGITLLSVGDREDPGPMIISGRTGAGGGTAGGVGANSLWMNRAARRLEEGIPWSRILEEMKEGAE